MLRCFEWYYFCSIAVILASSIGKSFLHMTGWLLLTLPSSSRSATRAPIWDQSLTLQCTSAQQSATVINNQNLHNENCSIYWWMHFLSHFMCIELIWKGDVLSFLRKKKRFESIRTLPNIVAVTAKHLINYGSTTFPGYTTSALWEY